MATVYKIHPAIGIARVGNSPDEFFIGPERPWEYPTPAGGFKDSQCRVKRQAARFHIFAHHDDGSVEEITDAEADITWTVHVANKKASYTGRGNTEPASDLNIYPGARTTNGPNQVQKFDTGTIHFSGQPVVTVPLGEMRSDTENRLLVLGGSGKSASPGGDAITSFWGNDGWYDDVADGPVSASIHIRATGTTHSVVGAWVIVAPPKFAPHQDSVTTLYDRVFQEMVNRSLATAPTATSYTKDIYPILKRARDMKWVHNHTAHNWADPVVASGMRTAIFARVEPPGGSTVTTENMPSLLGSDSTVTPVQYAHLQRWKDGTFNDDWVNEPTPDPNLTPSGLDQAALDAGVGAAFYPGIEAGGRWAGQRPILEADYTEAFRLNHATVQPGDIGASMALPWQADFRDCASSWWPVPRPNSVYPQGSNTRQNWARGVSSYQDMVDKWDTLGFVVKQATRNEEVERCDTASINLLTPHLDFVDIPQGPLGTVREIPLAIAFEVISPSSSVTLEYATANEFSHPQLVAGNPTGVTVGPTTSGVETARLWVIYRTGAVGSVLPQQTITVREPSSGQTWDILVDGNTVAHTTAAVALVLDRSGSMIEDRGDGVSKHASLQDSAEIFVELMREGDGVGLVRYNHDAQVVEPIKTLGDGGISDTNRNSIEDAIRGNSFDPQGATSIGDGIYQGRQILDATGSTYDSKALVVLTDGVENTPQYIADVAAQIDTRTYSIGFGTPQNTSAPALQNISGNTGGFLLVTGAIDATNRFLLQKYFVQILAGVTNAEVVLDPDGLLVPDVVERIPFTVSDADFGLEVIVLSPATKIIDFRLQTPSGRILEPWRALQENTMQYSLGRGVTYFRLALPTQLLPGRYDQAGTWHALLRLGSPQLEPSPDNEGGVDTSIARGLHASRAVQQRWAQSRLVQTRLVQSEEQRRFLVARDSGLSAAVETHVTRPQGVRVPYSLIVHTYSSVTLRAEALQDSFDPGAKIRLLAALTQSGLPVAAATVWADVVRPDGSEARLTLQRAADGDYEGQFAANRTGTYKIRVRARGETRDGLPFTRERSLTASVWRGGDHDAQKPPGSVRPTGNEAPDGPSDGVASHGDCCQLLKCLLKRGGVVDERLEKLLQAIGIDLDYARKCLERTCRDETSTRREP